MISKYLLSARRFCLMRLTFSTPILIFFVLLDHSTLSSSIKLASARQSSISCLKGASDPVPASLIPCFTSAEDISSLHFFFSLLWYFTNFNMSKVLPFFSKSKQSQTAMFLTQAHVSLSLDESFPNLSAIR